MSLPRYRTYKRSGVDWLPEVPAHWVVCAMKRVASLRSGESITAENINDSGDYPVFGGNGLRGYTTAFTHEGRFALIGRQGALCGNVNYAQGRFWASEHAVVAKPIEPLDTTWFGEMLRAMNLNQYSVSAAQPGLSVELVANIGIPFPPIEEQAGIATFLNRETAKIDALIAEQEKLIALLAEKRQATITHAVTRGLNPGASLKDSGIAWLGEVPVHWISKELRNVANVVRGASPRPAGDPRYFAKAEDEGADIPWVTVAEITKDEDMRLHSTSEYLTSLGGDHSKRFERGMVVFSNSGATLGVPKILDIDCCANDGVLAFQNLNAEVCSQFLYYFLLTTTERLRTEMKQGGGQPNLNTDIVKSIGFVQPPIEEQRAIVEFIRLRLGVFDRLRSESEHAVLMLRERRSALITAAVTGQIDVRNAIKEEAA